MFVEFDQVEPANRYSAERTSHQVNFSCFAPSAKQVSVVGDFNYWDPDANPMHSMPDGGWCSPFLFTTAITNTIS